MDKSVDLNGNCHHVKSANRSSRYLQFKRNLSNTQLLSPNSNDTNSSPKPRNTYSPIRLAQSPTTVYDSGVCNRREARSAPSSIVQDIVQMKIMLIKLRRILSKEDDDKLFLDSDNVSKMAVSSSKEMNGGSVAIPSENKLADDARESKDLHKEIFLLRKQLEEKDDTILLLQERIEQLKVDNRKTRVKTVNSTTQTEKSRPVSSGPLLLQDFSSDANLNYSNRECVSFDGLEGAPTLRLHNSLRKSLPRLWRRSGEPSSLQVPPNKGSTSHIPRRAKSHSRSTAV